MSSCHSLTSPRSSSPREYWQSTSPVQASPRGVGDSHQRGTPSPEIPPVRETPHVVALNFPNWLVDRASSPGPSSLIGRHIVPFPSFGDVTSANSSRSSSPSYAPTTNHPTTRSFAQHSAPVPFSTNTSLYWRGRSPSPTNYAPYPSSATTSPVGTPPGLGPAVLPFTVARTPERQHSNPFLVSPRDQPLPPSGTNSPTPTPRLTAKNLGAPPPYEPRSICSPSPPSSTQSSVCSQQSPRDGPSPQQQLADVAVIDVDSTQVSRLSREFDDLERLGSGCFSEVRLVRHRLDGQLYAVKTLKRRIGGELDKTNRLQETFALAAASGCPNIVQYYDVWIERNLLVIRMEHCAGGDVFTRYKPGSDKDRPTESELIDFVRQIAAGILHLHARGIAHMDVKCENCLIAQGSYGPVYKLADLGIARRIWDNNHEGNNDMEGDARYLCRQFLANEATADQADVYSLGASVYELAINQRLPQGGLPPLRVHEAPLAGLEAYSTAFRELVQSMMTADLPLRLTAFAVATHPVVRAWCEQQTAGRPDYEQFLFMEEQQLFENEMNRLTLREALPSLIGVPPPSAVAVAVAATGAGVHSTKHVYRTLPLPGPSLATDDEDDAKFLRTVALRHSASFSCDEAEPVYRVG